MQVRSLVILGSGWHPHLFREEARALLGPIEVLHKRMAFLTQSDDVIDRISGASLIDEALNSTSRLWVYNQEITPDEVASHVAEWSKSFLPEGTFSIRARKLGSGVGSLSRREIEVMTGAKIFSEKKPVNLENPDHEVVVVLAGPDDSPSQWDERESGELILWGLRDPASIGTYSGPSPTERPFFKPVTLDPRLARLLVCLSFSRGKPSVIVDPFCGTGGIAIEASNLGLQVLASDLDSRMVEGTRTNMEWVSGKSEYSVKRCPANQIHEMWGDMPGCSFVFDPPYGRNAWASEDGLDLLLGALVSARAMSPDGTVCTMLPSSPEALHGPISDSLQVMGMDWGPLKERIIETGWEVSVCSPVRVHKSLSRLVVLCHPAD